MFKIIHMMIVLFLHMALAFPSETRENAMGFLSRRRRANSGAEELLPGNLQQECIDEVCNYEEAREVFETDLAGLQQWWAEKHGEPEADNNTGIIVGCVIGAIVLIIIIVIIVAATKASKKSTPSDYNQYPRGERPPPYAVAQGYLHTGHGQMPQIKIRDPQLRLAVSNCYIERSSVSLGSLVKEGNFGMVYKSTWRLEDGTEKTVAAKTMKHIETETQLMNFLKEGVMMKEFNHKHVLKIYGVCTAPGEYPIIVLPFMANGDLRTFLRDANNELTILELIGFCLDICSGMQHLASKGFVHRDLAARNVFVNHRDPTNDRHVVKVGDFGLSRDLHQHDYYRSQQHSELPLKWMAPESIKFHTYSEKSDVWAFGITIWEAMTRSVAPYATVDPIFILEHIEHGNRMEKPRHCPDPLYKIMKACWTFQQERRPTFDQILPKINSIFQERQAQIDAQNRTRNPSAPDPSELDRLSSRDEEVDLNESDLRHHSSRAIPNDYGKEPNT